MTPYAQTPHPLRADPFYLALKDELIASTGLAYYGDRDDDLAARVEARMGELRVRDCAGYLDLLRDGPRGETELDALIEDLTIGETFFFRHVEVFDALRDRVIPDLIERNRETRRLRIWSAGCSTGAEPYSVAILLRTEFASRLAGWDISILGTDINREFLARAAEGRFEEWAFRSTPADLRARCFVPSGGSWRLKAPFREGVAFQYHNLVKHPFPSLLLNLFAFDLILCRNVTIYFSQDVVRKIVGHFHNSLAEGGWLAVGHAEPNVETFRAFRAVNAVGATLYQKNHAATAEPDWLGWTPAPPVAPAPTRTRTRPPAGPPRVPDPDPSADSPELVAVRRLADGGDLRAAAAACRARLERDRLDPSAHFYLALILEQMGQHAETEESLRRAIYLDRNFTLAHYYLGLLRQKQGQAALAARSFRNVLDLLAREGDDGTVLDADGMTAADLRALTRGHLEVLETT